MGQSGQGKTYLTKRLITHHRRVFIADWNAEYIENDDGTQYAEPMDIQTAGALASKLSNPKEAFRIAIVGSQDEIIESARVAWSVGQCLLVIEEIDMYCRGHMLPPDINGIVQVGRHRAVSLFGISRNPAAIPKQFLSQSDCRVSFRQTEPRHLKALEEYGFNAENVKSLDKGTYLKTGESNLLRRAVQCR